MALARLVFRPTARLAAGALGVGAAVALPLVATLVLSGLHVTGDARPWLVYDPDGGILDLPADAAPTLAVAEASREGRRWVAYTAGAPVVAPGHMRVPEGATVPQSLGGQPLVADPGGTELPLVPPGTILVHPSQLPGAPVVAALVDAKPTWPGVHAVPARGAQAFEEATTEGVRMAGLAAVAASVPVAGLVVATFARLEMREARHEGAVLSALGGTWHGRAVLAGRTALVVLLGTAAAAALAFLAWRFGGPSFHPQPFPTLALLAAAAVPGLGGLAIGLAATRGFGRQVADTLRHGPREPAPVQVRWPLALRPLLTGFSLVPTLVLAAGLFVLDVGMPLAAATVPAQVAGGPGEWVWGSEGGIRPGEGVPAAPAVALRRDPRIEQVVAETVAPTLLGGHPAVVRGGDWAELAGYHGLELAGAEPADGVVLGARLAARHGWTPGDRLVLQGSQVPFVALVQVRGVAEADGVLADEAFVGADLGRRLAGLAPGEVSFLRVRPDTLEARDAFARPGPDLHVVALRLEPRDPPAGTVAHVRVEAVNSGGAEGARTFTLRLDGAGVASAALRLPAYGQGDVSIPFLVPTGPFTVEVNPALGAAGGTPQHRLEGPPQVAAGERLAVRLVGRDGQPVPGVAVQLFPSLEAAASRTGAVAPAIATDAEGFASFAPPGRDVVARAATDPPVFLQVAAEREPTVAVEAVWTDATVDPVGSPAQVFATVRNPGTAAANATLRLTRGDDVIQVAEVTLEPGERRTIRFATFVAPPGETLAVEGVQVRFGSTSTDPSPPPVGPGIRRGEALQAQLADRLLGNARVALAALAVVALASSLAVAVLGTQRALHGRRHVFGVLAAFGHPPDAIRARAALEAGLLAGAAMALAIGPAKLVFAAVAAWGPPVFGHAVPDPIDALFAFQCIAAFAGAGAVAAYAVAGRVARAPA